MYFFQNIELAGKLYESGQDKFVDAIKIASRSLIKNPPIDMIEWMEANLEQSYDMAAERAGQFKLTQSQRGIAKALQDDNITTVVYRKPPRSGFSTFLAATTVFYAVYNGDDTIFYERNEDECQNWHNKKLYPFIKGSPKIENYLRADTKAGIQDRWSDRILINGASIQIRSVQTDGSFRAVKGRFLAADEASDPAFQSKIKGEGSKIDLIKTRGLQFADMKLAVGSTPTHEDTCLVSQLYEKSDKRVFRMPFPCCGCFNEFVKNVGVNNLGPDHPMAGPGLYYQHNDAGVVTACWYQCADCGSPIYETAKADMVSDPNSEWVPTCFAPIDPTIAGFDDWAIYHSEPQMTWLHICKEHFGSLSDVEKRKTFKNHRLCLPWSTVEQKPVAETALMARSEPYSAPCPDGVIAIVGGMDSQEGSEKKSPRHEIVWVGYGANEESWVLGWDVLDDHEPFSVDAKAQIKELLDREWEKADGTRLQCAALGVDVGWQMNSAVDMCRDPEFRKRGVVPMRGASDRNMSTPAINKKMDLHKATGTQFYRVGGQSIVETLLRRLKISNGPEAIHFPRSLPVEFYTSLTSVKYEKDKRTGRKYYADISGNEVLDCMKYAYAVLQHLKLKNSNLRSALKLDYRNRLQSGQSYEYKGEDRSISSTGSHNVKSAQPIAGKRLTYDDLAIKKVEQVRKQADKILVAQNERAVVEKPKKRFGRISSARW